MPAWSTRALAFALLLGACSPPACAQEEEELVASDVEVLVRDDGRLGEAARLRLAARGRYAIAHLEPALYRADPSGRCRVVGALADLGTSEVTPILVHLAAHDPDEPVRACATRELSKISRPSDASGVVPAP